MFATLLSKYKNLIIILLVAVAFLTGAGVGSFKKYFASPPKESKSAVFLPAGTDGKQTTPDTPEKNADSSKPQMPLELGVPQLPGLQMSSCQSLKGGYLIQGSTLRPPADVILYFHNRMNDYGWTDVNIVSERGQHSLTSKKQKNTLSIKAVEENKGTMVTIKVEPSG